MKLTYYGHSCFSVNIGGKDVLFDPFVTNNEKVENINVDEIPADFILVSHGHFDHIDDLKSIAERTGAQVVCNFDIMTWLDEEKGLENLSPLNQGGKTELDFGTVKMVAAVHGSRLPDGSDGGSPGGFVVKSDEGNFYFAGDTALTMDMKLIPDFAKLDFCVLPIGDTATMGVEDAIRACDFVECDKVFGVHYNTFPFIEIDKDEAVRKFKEAGKELILMEAGESREF